MPYLKRIDTVVQFLAILAKKKKKCQYKSFINLCVLKDFIDTYINYLLITVYTNLFLKNSRYLLSNAKCMYSACTESLSWYFATRDKQFFIKINLI